MGMNVDNIPEEDKVNINFKQQEEQSIN